MINDTEEKYVLLKAKLKGNNYLVRLCSESIWGASQTALRKREYLNNNSFIAYIDEKTFLEVNLNGITRNQFEEIY